MTEAELITHLAGEVVQCSFWRWDLDGMVFFLGDPTSTGPRIVNSDVADAGNARQEYRWLPLITHPATKGWLLHLLREQLKAPVAVMNQFEGEPDWRVVRWDVDDGTVDALPIGGASEHETLVQALMIIHRQQQTALHEEWRQWNAR